MGLVLKKLRPQNTVSRVLCFCLDFYFSFYSSEPKIIGFARVFVGAGLWCWGESVFDGGFVVVELCNCDSAEDIIINEGCLFAQGLGCFVECFCESVVVDDGAGFGGDVGCCGVGVDVDCCWCEDSDCDSDEGKDAEKDSAEFFLYDKKKNGDYCEDDDGCDVGVENSVVNSDWKGDGSGVHGVVTPLLVVSLVRYSLYYTCRGKGVNTKSGVSLPGDDDWGCCSIVCSSS